MKKKLNKTKIVATIGPACNQFETLSKIIEAGTNVCRLNFSHGKHEDHLKVIDLIRDYNHANHANICILQDLQGPKLRIGEVENNAIELKNGQKLMVTTKECLSTSELLFVNYKNLPKEVKENEKILLDDGKIQLKVISTDGKELIETQVVYGGILSSKKGFNLPETKTTMPCLTEKDLKDLEFGLKHNVEWIALSFVRNAEDIRELRGIIEKHGKKTRIIAKIEKPEGVENFEAILKETDGVMVARGDLGVEMPLQQVPVIQKNIIKKCIIAGKPVIVATQMMESMIVNPSPTRAEVTDIANAVYDGADAVMLSAETSVGAYPSEAVSMMSSILYEVEKENEVYFKGQKPTPDSPTFMSDEICFTACRMSDHIKAKAIIGMTYSGYTAFKISSFRPKSNIFIFTSNISLLNTLSLVWGVKGFYYNKYNSTDETYNDQVQLLKKQGMISHGDIIVHTASMPIQSKARTNSIKIDVVI